MLQNEFDIVEPSNFKGESGVFFTLVFKQWCGGHFDNHVWRLSIVLLDLARSVCAICTCIDDVVCFTTQYKPKCMCDTSPRHKGNTPLTKMLCGCSYEKIYIWWQGGKFLNFKLKKNTVMDHQTPSSTNSQIYIQ